MPPIATERQGPRLRDDVARITQLLAHEMEELIAVAPEQWHVQQPNWPSDWDALEAIGRTLSAHGVTALWLTAGLFQVMVQERLEDLAMQVRDDSMPESAARWLHGEGKTEAGSSQRNARGGSVQRMVSRRLLGLRM